MYIVILGSRQPRTQSALPLLSGRRKVYADLGSWVIATDSEGLEYHLPNQYHRRRLGSYQRGDWVPHAGRPTTQS